MTSTFHEAFMMFINLYKEEPFMEQLLVGNDLNQLLLTISKKDIEAHVVTGYQ
jgi:hypothetical protein